jgi:hypothetical protein
MLYPAAHTSTSLIHSLTQKATCKLHWYISYHSHSIPPSPTVSPSLVNVTDGTRLILVLHLRHFPFVQQNVPTIRILLTNTRLKQPGPFSTLLDTKASTPPPWTMLARPTLSSLTRKTNQTGVPKRFPEKHSQVYLVTSMKFQRLRHSSSDIAKALVQLSSLTGRKGHHRWYSS